MDKRSYQILGAALRRRVKKIEMEIATLEAMEEEVKVWKDEVKAIEERVAIRRKDNAARKQRLKEDQEANQSSLNRVHPGIVGVLHPGFMFGEVDQSPVKHPVQTGNLVCRLGAVILFLLTTCVFSFAIRSIIWSTSAGRKLKTLLTVADQKPRLRPWRPVLLNRGWDRETSGQQPGEFRGSC